MALHVSGNSSAETRRCTRLYTWRWGAVSHYGTNRDAMYGVSTRGGGSIAFDAVVVVEKRAKGMKKG